MPRATIKKGAGVFSDARLHLIKVWAGLDFAVLAASLSFPRSFIFFRLRYRDTDTARAGCQWFLFANFGANLLNESAAGFLREDQFLVAGIESNIDQIAQADLTGRYQVRERIDKKTLDGPFQVPGAVL